MMEATLCVEKRRATLLDIGIVLIVTIAGRKAIASVNGNAKN